MGRTVYVCKNDQCDECTCDGNTFGYTYPADKLQRVHICRMVFSYPDYWERVQTLVHELSHFNSIGSTQDLAYGPTECQRLARVNPFEATDNADSIGYFAKFEMTPCCH